MQFSSMKQQHNPLINDYQNQQSRVMKHFDYDPYTETTYSERLQALQEKNMDRDKLIQALTEMNNQWGAPGSTYDAIERLKEKHSAVVIGGQQAGLLTGPMYTINKVISVIQFAKQQESQLGVPIVPVFWIAGEDHDFDEVNHVFVSEQMRLKKHSLTQQPEGKQPVSDIPIDGEALTSWVDQLFETLPETEHTKQLYHMIQDCWEQSSTYVDFFARFLYQLLDGEPIILADSGHPAMRHLEQEAFSHLIEQQEDISHGVHSAIQQLQEQGYSPSLDVGPNDAHLFYHLNNERVLLVRDDEGNWVGKQNEVLLTTQEVLQTARETPERLSNNVVTRPIMQEWLFPTLAFIGGPGEVGYWAALKPAFHALGMEMPPVQPRLSFTLIDRNVEKTLTKFGINAEYAVEYGLEDSKVTWLAAQHNPPVERVAQEVKDAIRGVHEPLRQMANDMGANLGELGDKNLYYLHSNIDFIEKRLRQAVEEKYDNEIRQFDLAHHAIHPANGLQERIWNPLPFMNNYGPCFIREMAREPFSFRNNHYIVYL
ncbi:bacillithiol biosynthesis cysteine-adding enzyme BshC [Lentibacillus halophilus]|uniref:Putative cysteine ligase BshC n=1 Tax=Lentibacillus halophilus TaxID=295065 RepID=A0ABP3JBT7_9BACI